MTIRKRLTASEICMAVAHLTEEERGKVKCACDFHGVEDSEQPGRVEEDENFLLFYDVLADVLLEQVGTKLPKRVTYLSNVNLRQLRKGFAVVHELCERLLPHARQTTFNKFYTIVIQMVLRYIQELGIPATVKIIGQQLENSPALLNREFPGYLKAGLIPLITSWGKLRPVEEEEEL